MSTHGVKRAVFFACLAVVLLAGAGCPKKVAVPDLTGLTRAAAEQLLAGAGLRAGSVAEAHSTLVAAGLVMGQSPAAGVQVAKDSAVDMVISLGSDTPEGEGEGEGEDEGEGEGELEGEDEGEGEGEMEGEDEGEDEGEGEGEGEGEPGMAWFVVANPDAPGQGSYVLPLTEADDIEHARAVIEDPAAAGALIVVARIEAGTGVGDYRNCDPVNDGLPWSWHVAEFLGFADNTIEILDGWAQFVEDDVAGWMANTNSTIGFWSYRVIAELEAPCPPPAGGDEGEGEAEGEGEGEGEGEPAAWAELAPLPVPRFFLGVAAANGKIYAMGGYSTYEGYQRRVDEYDPATDTWTRRQNMNYSCQSLTAVALNGLIYTVGGNQSGTYTNRVEAYDPVNDVWIPKAGMHMSRHTASAAALNGKIYAMGGQGTVAVAESLEEYDPATDTWTLKSVMPGTKYVHNAAALNFSVLVLGGYDVTVRHSPDAYRYNVVSGAWSDAVPDPVWRSEAAAASSGYAVYYAGGYSNRTEALVEKFDGSTWSAITPMPEGRLRHGAAVLDGKLYIIGGQTGSPGSFTDTGKVIALDISR